VKLTAAYTIEREQFGKPIATFQAVGQRAAEAYIDTEGVHLTAWQAAWRLAEGLPAAAEVAVASTGPTRAPNAPSTAPSISMVAWGWTGTTRLHRHFLRTKHLGADARRHDAQPAAVGSVPGHRAGLIGSTSRGTAGPLWARHNDSVSRRPISPWSSSSPSSARERWWRGFSVTRWAATSSCGAARVTSSRRSGSRGEVQGTGSRRGPGPALSGRKTLEPRDPVRDSDLTDDERRFAREHHDAWVP